MSEDVKTEQSAVAEDLANAPKKRGPRVRGSGRAYSQTRRREMETFVIDLRKERGVVQYDELKTAVMSRFGCGVSVAEKVVAAASAVVLDQFWKKAADAPAMIFDGYVEIYQCAMKKGDLREARKTLDSVRDMFGIRGTTRVDLTLRRGGDHDGPTLDDLNDVLTDAQLEAFAALDAARPGILDVDAVEQDIDDVASAGANALAFNDDNNDGGNDAG